jgi:hypothetical protein
MKKHAYIKKYRLFREYSGKGKKVIKIRYGSNRIDHSFIPGHNRSPNPMGNNSRRER